MERKQRHIDRAAGGTGQRQALFVTFACGVRVRLPERRIRDAMQRRHHSRQVSKFTPDCQRLIVESERDRILCVVDRSESSRVQCSGPYWRGRPLGWAEQRLEPVARFGRVASQEPEPAESTREPQPDLQCLIVSPLERPAQRLTEVVLLELKLSCRG